MSEGATTPTPVEQTPEEALKSRIQKFVDAYGVLVQEHKVDFATYPMFVPDGNGGFKIVIQTTPVDISNQPVKSDFVAGDAQ